MELKQIISTIGKVDGRRKLKDCDYRVKLHEINKDGYFLYLTTYCKATDVNAVAKMTLQKLSHFGVKKFCDSYANEFELTEQNILMNFKSWLLNEQRFGIFFSVKF